MVGKGIRVETGRPVRRLVQSSGHKAVVALAAVRPKKRTQPFTHTDGWVPVKLQLSVQVYVHQGWVLAQGEAQA